MQLVQDRSVIISTPRNMTLTTVSSSAPLMLIGAGIPPHFLKLITSSFVQLNLRVRLFPHIILLSSLSPSYTSSASQSRIWQRSCECTRSIARELRTHHLMFTSTYPKKLKVSYLYNLPIFLSMSGFSINNNEEIALFFHQNNVLNHCPSFRLQRSYFSKMLLKILCFCK